MCNPTCIQFAKKYLTEDVVHGKSVVEVGSLDVNGSLRPIVEAFCPSQYIGVDLFAGPGVDMICNAEELIDLFGPERFDVLISTEVLEHVRDWKKVINNFKHILKPRGKLLVTTRSRGFFYHGYPNDFWRYEIGDMKNIFSDFNVISLQQDLSAPGLFIFAEKPNHFIKMDLTSLKLYSMVKFRRADRFNYFDVHIARLLYATRRHLAAKIRNFFSK